MGDVCGQDDWSSGAHASCSRRQAWKRLGDNRTNRRSGRNGTQSRARSTARRIRVLSRPSGRRSCVKVNPELRSRARRSSALSFLTRRRSSRTSCWSSNVFTFVTSMVTATIGAFEASYGPSIEEPRDPWRWSRPPCCGRDPAAGGRSAAAGAAKSSCGQSSGSSFTPLNP